MSETIRPIRIEAPVAEVTLLEDRAHVVRRGSVSLPSGSARIEISDVAPVLSDKTLSLRIGDKGVTVVDAKVSRRAVVQGLDDEDETSDDDATALRREAEELSRELYRKRSDLMALNRHAKGLEEIAAHSFAELAGDVSWGSAIGNEWEARLQQLRERERDLRVRISVLAIDINDSEQRSHRLKARLAAVQNPSQKEWAGIQVDVHAEKAGDYEIQLDYVVPGACWRPYHTAELREGEGASLRFSTDACVWQNTGEDWREAALFFSTERLSLGAEPPQLTTDFLRLKPRADTLVVEKRDEAITTVGLGTTTAARAEELPGIDDGGLALKLSSAGAATVPSDGRPYRIALSNFTSEAKTELVAFPERSPSVYTRSTQSNQGSMPILAGPVDLIRENGFVGRTSVLFIAAGETFELGWGPEPELRLKRTEEKKAEKSRTLSAWVERAHHIQLRFSNLGASSRSIRVTERIPVSEVDRVQIELDAKATSGAARPDADGFVEWTLRLPPFGQKQLELHYNLRKHQDVVGV